MLKIANYPYLNLDGLLPIEKLPENITDAIADSYDLIKQNTWQKTTHLNGDLSNCNWQSKGTEAKVASDFFRIEVTKQTVAPMWILDLTVDANRTTTNLYDSLANSTDEWRNISLRTDLPKSWNPFLDWLRNLKCFDRLGRTSLLLTRPGIPPQYHRDIGVADESFKPYPHRQEFIWLKITDDKTLYILDEDRTPIEVKSKTAFFNHQNWHGSHEALPFWSFSFKIEGIFNKDFRSQLNIDSVTNYD